MESALTLDATRSYSNLFKALSESIQVVDRFLTYEDHGPKNRATWANPLSAIYLAQWLRSGICRKGIKMGMGAWNDRIGYSRT